MPEFAAVVVTAAEAIGAALGTTAVTVGTTAITWGNVLAAAYVAGSVIDGRRRAANTALDARRGYLASMQDRSVMLRSATVARRSIYGWDRVSGPLVDAFVTGDKGQYLHVLIALAGRQVAQIQQVYFNEFWAGPIDSDGFVRSGLFTRSQVHTVAVSLAASGGTVTLGHGASRVVSITSGTDNSAGDPLVNHIGWSHTAGSNTITGVGASGAVWVNYEWTESQPRVRIHRFLGTPGQTVPNDLITESGGRRTSAHTGQGLAWMWVRLEWDSQVFGQIGFPNISALVQGFLVRDPRTNTTAWSENAALCSADFALDQQLGLRSTSAQVPDAELIAQANICDELVIINAGGGVESRYTCNGTLSADTSRLANFDALLDSMSGGAVWAQGRWSIRAGAHPTPEPWTLTADHLADGPATVQRGTARRERINSVTALYRDPGQLYAEVPAPMVTNATYQAQDGGRRITRRMQLPLVQNAVRAQRLAKILLERARQATTTQLVCNWRAYNLRPGQVVPVTLAKFGWTNKLFEVRRRELDLARKTVTYVLRETAPAVWDWNYGQATTVDVAPDTELPNPLAVPPEITGLACASGTAHLQALADGSLITRGLVTWGQSSDTFVVHGGQIEIQYKLDTDAQWQSAPAVSGGDTQAYIGPLSDARVTLVRVRPVNAVGRYGGWATVVHMVVGKTAAPSAVAGLGGAVSKGRIVWMWGPCPDADYGLTEVRDADTGWGSSTVAPLFAGAASQWAEVVSTTGTRTRYFRHIDSSGNASASSASAAVSVAAGDLVQDGAAGATGPTGPIGSTGPMGPAASLLVLLTTAQAYTFGAAGAAVPSSQTISMTAQLANLSGTAAFTCALYDVSGTNIGTPTMGGSGNTRTLTVAQFSTAQYATISATLSGHSDQITVVRLRDGAAAVAGLLTNESVALAADNAGTVGSFATAGGVFAVWDGTTNVTGAGVTYSVVSSSGVTITINSATGAYSVSAMSADVGTARLRAVYGSVTIDKDFSIAKSRAGAAGAAGTSTTVAKDQGVSGEVGNFPGGGATNANVVVRTVFHANNTGAAVDVQIESGLTNSVLSWNMSPPTGVTSATLEWSSASLSGSIVLCSSWPNSAVTSQTVSPAGAYVVSVPAGETLTALLRVIVVHMAEAIISFSSSRVVLTAIKP